MAATGIPDGTCTTDPAFDPPQQGVLSQIVGHIQCTLTGISSNGVGCNQPGIAPSIFTGITSDPGFRYAINGVLTLYVIIMGILFMCGMLDERFTLYDFAFVMIKFVIVSTLISGSGWSLFYNNFAYYFAIGRDQLINLATQVTLPNTPNLNPNQPFSVLDYAVAQASSQRMAATLLAVFTTLPYGPVYSVLLTMALGAFFLAAMRALWVYLMSVVMSTLLLGLAPIFISCLLFSRTRHLFDGWLNQLVNAGLQPVLLFMFFGFFSAMIGTYIYQIESVPVCWTQISESMRGSPFAQHAYRFAKFNSQTGTWNLYPGVWDFLGATGADEGPIAHQAPPPTGDPSFPIDILTVLTLLILSTLAGRFNRVMIAIARELSGAVTDLSPALDKNGKDWIHRAFGGGGGGKGKRGIRRSAGDNVREARVRAAPLRRRQGIG